ncbi:MAG TPA: NAD(P)-dependent oxidoreductase [Spirochaetota bacterium]|nr:NAD(P)-dependent oxidoreductase [Spirochaetota bacterium]HSA13783.1 NAD(P)-dependent oxidoreductase [Spirochaetota bacterium]
MILITGCTTLMGKKLTERLLSAGNKIRCLDFEKPKNFTKNVDFIEGDVLDIVTVRKACKGVETIIHIMDLPSPGHYSRKYMKKLNINGTQNLLTIAQKEGVKNFFFMSSYEVYGRAKAIPVRQDDPKKPVTRFGKDKLKAENICWKELKKNKIAITIFRPALITGPETDDPTMLITLFMAMAMSEANRMYISGNGDNRFQLLHPDDAADAVFAAYKRGGTSGKVYNLGSDNVPTQMEQIIKIKELARLDCEIRHLTPDFSRFLSIVFRPFKIRYLTPEHVMMLTINMLMDCQMAKKDLNWEPKKDNLGILLETIEWYKKEKL